MSAVFGPLFRMRRLGRLLRWKSMTLRTNVGTIHIRPTDSDADTFIQVFVGGCYDLSNFAQYQRVVAAYERIQSAGGRPVIIDAGANVGAAAKWFSRKFPNAFVVAVEPDPGSAELCRKNLRGAPNAMVVEAAVGSTAGAVNVVANKDSVGIRTERSETGRAAIITIPEAVRLAGEGARLFIAKIDIEGFESDLFAQHTDWATDAPVVVVEPHDWRFPGKGTSRNFRKVFSDTDHEMLILGGDTLAFIR